MNRDRAKELLPIIEAFANGEDIEVERDRDSWKKQSSYSFSDSCNYRIKHKIREFWICNANKSNKSNHHWISEEDKETGNWDGTSPIKVREVIE